MVKVNSTDKIEKLMGYLQIEISQSRLDDALAKIFLYAMWNSRNESNIIFRPKWTFAVPEFIKYLNFYKKFNLLHWNGSQTKFLPDDDLYYSNDVMVKIYDKDTIDIIIEMGNNIPEFKNYYS